MAAALAFNSNANRSVLLGILNLFTCTIIPIALAMPGPITPAYALMPIPAEKILTAWMRERPGALAVKMLTPTTQEHLLVVLQQILSHPEEVNVDREDV